MKAKDGIQVLYPKETTVKFQTIDHEFTVNKISLADDAWLLNEMGGKEGLTSVFNNGEVKSIIRIFYRLLGNSDKEFITKNIEFTTHDEDGNETIVKSNIDKLCYLLNLTDIKAISDALMRARGVSLPPPDQSEIVDLGDEKEKKKNLRKK